MKSVVPQMSAGRLSAIGLKAPARRFIFSLDISKISLYIIYKIAKSPKRNLYMLVIKINIRFFYINGGVAPALLLYKGKNKITKKLNIKEVLI